LLTRRSAGPPLMAAMTLVRGRLGRSWAAPRDVALAADITGLPPLSAKLSAFAVSSFFVGISGAMFAFIYTGSVEALAFDIDRSFQILFMVIIGGLGSILGSFLGAGFIVLLPLLLLPPRALLAPAPPVYRPTNLPGLD